MLREHRQKFAELGCFLALAPEAALDIANDKDRTLMLAEELGIAQPKSLRIGAVDDLAAAVTEFGFPFVLKLMVSWPGGTVERLIPVDVINHEEAGEVTERFLKAGTGVLAQQWVPGRREGVSLLIVGDEVVAACGHVAHRTTPPLGGASVVRESIEAPDDIMHAAVLWRCREVEFRRDAENRPLLMEINASLVGPIENVVQSGVDFPLMIWCWATGQDVTPTTSHRYGVVPAGSTATCDGYGRTGCVPGGPMACLISKCSMFLFRNLLRPSL